MSSDGYIKLYRSIKKNFVWKDKPFTKGQAWIDLLMDARFDNGGYFKRGIWIPLERGQIGKAETTLADEWGWSRGKVRRFLESLKTERMVTLKQDNKTTIITICNYDIFQGKENIDGTPNSTADDTPNGHQTDTKRTQRNKEKNGNKENKNTFSEDSTEYRIANFLYHHIKQNNPNFKEPNLKNWSKDADLLIRVDKRDVEEVKRLIEWVQSDDFWKSNILSVSKLRKKYDQLVMKMKQKNKPKQIQRNAPRTCMEMFGNQGSDNDIEVDDYEISDFNNDGN